MLTKIQEFTKKMQFPDTFLDWMYSEQISLSRYFKVFPCDLGYTAEWPAMFLAPIGEVKKVKLDINSR